MAFDLYSFFDANCRRQTGVLVHVDAARAIITGLDGVAITVPRKNVRSLVRHQVLENPLTVIRPNAALRPHLRQIWTEKSKQPTFSGWVTGFHDDLLIFFDFQGKSHVIQAEEIVRIRPYEPTRAVLLRQYRVPRLMFPRAIVPCGETLVSRGRDDVMPSRVIADRIKIDDLLTALADRYRGFAGLEERTLVYARPFHFLPTLRLGLTYSQNSGFARFFPFYFNYTGGTPYRFQSRILVGSLIHETLPFLRRTLAASSDIKSHFFHATFVGQLPALPAESDAFITDNGEIKTFTVTTSYNYLILMGADYWRLSASAGAAYFSLRVAGQLEAPYPGGKKLTFQVTAPATSMTPVFRLQYRGNRWTARALYYRTRLSGKPQTNEPGLPGPGGKMPDVELKAKSDAFRLGTTVTLPLRLSASADQVFTFTSGEATSGGDKMAVRYFQSETALMLGAEFGRYIAVKAFGRLLLRKYEQKANSGQRQTKSVSNTDLDALFGGVLEFVF